MGEGDRLGLSQPVSCGPSLRLQKWMLSQVRTKPDVKHKDIKGAGDTECASFSHLLKKELMLSNCGSGEDSWESLGLQDQTSSS